MSEKNEIKNILIFINTKMPSKNNIDIYDQNMTESEAMAIQEEVKHMISNKNYQPKKNIPSGMFISIDKFGQNKKY